METFSTPKAEIRYLEAGILETLIQPFQVLEPEDLHVIVEANQQLAGGKKYGALFVMGHLSSISKEGMLETLKPEFSSDTIARALLADSAGHKLIGEFYLKLGKPGSETKLFTDRNEAINWLRSKVRHQ